MDWKEIGISSGISVLALAALGWLLRTYVGDWLTRDIQHQYDVKLERIRAERGAELEQLKGEITVSGMREQLRFDRSDSKAREVVIEAFYRLLKLQHQARLCVVIPYHSKDKSILGRIAKQFGVAAQHFQSYFGANALHLPAGIADAMQSLQGSLNTIALDSMKEDEEAYMAAVDRMSELPARVSSLEQDIRKLLGSNEVMK